LGFAKIIFLLPAHIFQDLSVYELWEQEPFVLELELRIYE